jgi:hypothetical protein
MDDDDANADFIRAQLTTARWHLDRAAGADPATVRRNLHDARQAYDNVVRLLPKVALSGRQRLLVQRELAAVRDRLLAAGEDMQS